MHTILGANGSIGIGIAEELNAHHVKVRIVSRLPKPKKPNHEAVVADLTNAEQVFNAVKGSEVVYLTAGLVYDIKIWQSQWPIIMRNVIDACKKHRSRLVFFDNVYMYGKVSGWMSESTPIHPMSKKGEVRARIASMLTGEVKSGNLTALIARAPDFYGPTGTLGFVNFMVFDNHAKGKSAQWLMDENVKHTYIYTPDAAKATAMLGMTSDAFNQVWHLPSDRNVISGKEMIELSANAFGVKPNYITLKKWMIQMYGWMDSNVKESVEMLYQYDSDYLFDSSKFEKRFGFTPTTYKVGIESIAKSYKESYQ